MKRKYIAIVATTCMLIGSAAIGGDDADKAVEQTYKTAEDTAKDKGDYGDKVSEYLIKKFVNDARKETGKGTSTSQ